MAHVKEQGGSYGYEGRSFLAFRSRFGVLPRIRLLTSSPARSQWTEAVLVGLRRGGCSILRNDERGLCDSRTVGFIERVTGSAATDGRWSRPTSDPQRRADGDESRLRHGVWQQGVIPW